MKGRRTNNQREAHYYLKIPDTKSNLRMIRLNHFHLTKQEISKERMCNSIQLWSTSD